MDHKIQWAKGWVEFCEMGPFFRLRVSGPQSNSISFSPPAFQVDGETRSDFVFVSCSKSRPVNHAITEYELRFRTTGAPTLHLMVVLRLAESSSVIRFKYRLSTDTTAVLTKSHGRDETRYFEAEVDAGTRLTEIQFSNFDPTVHSYVPLFQAYTAAESHGGLRFSGPLAIFEGSDLAFLLGYEHGSEHPDTFVEFGSVISDEKTSVALEAAKGTYYNGQTLSPDRPYESIWFEAAIVGGDRDTLLREYREFVLKYMTANTESRKPYIFYNTWNHQERNKYFKNKPYLSEMNFERMQKEIDIAHALGIDVFVIDTGWFSKTGDWIVNTDRFPDGLRTLKQKLDDYGMKLGLWFNPTVAAKTSEVYQSHPEWAMISDGTPKYHEQIWETESSYGMCLASSYSDWYIEKLVQLHEDLGVSYFKWDGISQYGCNSPLHWHGTVENSPEERRDCYAFEMGRQMIRIVEEVTRRCPQVIVDFDVTEAGRFVGLGFLSVGKYFLINNGPYFRNFDIPNTVSINPDTINVFFYPGAARSRICRQGVRYDSFIPSVLFLTHFLPDNPRLSQENSFASLALGGNGIWGDLAKMDSQDIAFFSDQIKQYKDVAGEVLASYPRTKGAIGTSPEIYEKIDPKTGRGMIVFFTVREGTFTHTTQPVAIDGPLQVLGADEWKKTDDGQLQITVTLGRDGARVVYVKSE